jgi:hypothetical protein
MAADSPLTYGQRRATNDPEVYHYHLYDYHPQPSIHGFTESLKFSPQQVIIQNLLLVGGGASPEAKYNVCLILKITL